MKKIITLLSMAGFTAILSAQTGNVGINTPTPNNTLTVNGNQSVGIRYQDLNAPANGIIIEGNTGIGTSAPLSKLDVNGQAKIGDGSITASAPFSGSLLEMNSEYRGLRLPQVALANTTEYFPMLGSGSDFASKGMTVYNYNAALLGTTNYPSRGPGEYYWDGSGWVSKNSHGPQMADVYFSVGRNIYQNMPNNVWTPINFTTKYYDKGNNIGLPSNLFSVPMYATGLYQINISYTTEAQNFTAQSAKIGIFVNNVLVRSFAYARSEPRLGIETSASTSVYLQGGSVISFRYMAAVDQNMMADIDFYQISR